MFDFLFEISWWLENLIVWLVFTIITGFWIDVWARRREERANDAYKNWKIEVVLPAKNGSSRTESMTLFLEEVRTIEASEFERRKMVKSAFSDYSHNLDLEKVDATVADQIYRMDYKRRVLVVNVLQAEKLGVSVKR